MFITLVWSAIVKLFAFCKGLIRNAIGYSIKSVWWSEKFDSDLTGSNCLITGVIRKLDRTCKHWPHAIFPPLSSFLRFFPAMCLSRFAVRLFLFTACLRFVWRMERQLSWGEQKRPVKAAVVFGRKPFSVLCCYFGQKAHGFLQLSHLCLTEFPRSFQVQAT